MDRAALARAVAWIAPALEITDSRYRSGTRTAVELVADNTSSAGYVIGSRVPAERRAALRGARDRTGAERNRRVARLDRRRSRSPAQRAGRAGRCIWRSVVCARAPATSFSAARSPTRFRLLPAIRSKRASPGSAARRSRFSKRRSPRARQVGESSTPAAGRTFRPARRYGCTMRRACRTPPRPSHPSRST